MQYNYLWHSMCECRINFSMFVGLRYKTMTKFIIIITVDSSYSQNKDLIRIPCGDV